MADNGVACSMSRSGNVWDNAAMESFFSSLKTERIGKKVYRSRDAARADVFDYIERFYNPVRRHSTIGYLSPLNGVPVCLFRLSWMLASAEQRGEFRVVNVTSDTQSGKHAPRLYCRS